MCILERKYNLSSVRVILVPKVFGRKIVSRTNLISEICFSIQVFLILIEKLTRNDEFYQNEQRIITNKKVTIKEFFFYELKF